MTREIKFRVWDRKAKRWQYFFVPPETFGEREVFTYRFFDWKTLGQYTGLKDKNGKEIYERDIIRYTRKHWYCPGHPEHNKDLENICSIYWDEERHGFSNDSRPVKNGKVDRITSSGYLGFEDERADENIIEVIGNIYENKDLLNK